MKTLLFAGRAENLYHTLEKSNIQVNGQIRTGDALITGYTKEEIEPTDIMAINGINYHIDSVIERRDHKGTFTVASDKLNGYFKVKASYQEVLEKNR